MIKIKSLARELGTVVMTVEFDWNGETHELTIRRRISTLLGMTKEQILKMVRNRVMTERMHLGMSQLEDKLKDRMDIDLEVE